LSMVGNELTFHSKACAYRFLKEVVLMIEPESLSGAIREVLKRHEKRIEEAKKKMEKKI
jgi:large subunit ribosomal protein L24e